MSWGGGSDLRFSSFIMLSALIMLCNCTQGLRSCWHWAVLGSDEQSVNGSCCHLQCGSSAATAKGQAWYHNLDRLHSICAGLCLDHRIFYHLHSMPGAYHPKKSHLSLCKDSSICVGGASGWTWLAWGLLEQRPSP